VRLCESTASENEPMAGGGGCRLETNFRRAGARRNFRPTRRPLRTHLGGGKKTQAVHTVDAVRGAEPAARDDRERKCTYVQRV